tara:strand:- start:360 stop:488 length:129 start_codon:yes stop_codon:yes gene_type:complete
VEERIKKEADIRTAQSRNNNGGKKENKADIIATLLAYSIITG